MSNTTIPAETLQSVTTVTDRMHVIEKRMQDLNYKYNFDIDAMPLDEHIEMNNLINEWDELKQTRDRLKIGAGK